MRISNGSSFVSPSYTSELLYGLKGLSGVQRHVMVYVKGEEVQARVLFQAKPIKELITLAAAGYTIYRATVDISQNTLLSIVRFYINYDAARSHSLIPTEIVVQPFLKYLETACVGQTPTIITDYESPDSESFYEVKCKRCDGEGIIKFYDHIEDGICFGCRGKGKIKLRCY